MDFYETALEWEHGGAYYALSVAPEDMPVRGNVMASDNSDADRECEDRVLWELSAGNVWAWCCVRVTCTAGGVTGTAHLGGCSYASAEDFMAEDGYFSEMQAEARASLLERLEAASAALEEGRRA